MKVKLFFLIITFFGLCFSFSFIKFYDTINSYKANNNEVVQGVAVLTGGKGRVAKGIKIFKENQSIYMIISGVDKSIKNIDVIHKDLLESDKLFIDKKSETTVENAEEIIKWATQNNLSDISIITSDYHMPRSILILSKKSKNLNFYADPVISHISMQENLFSNFKLLIFLLEEHLKYLLCYLVL